MIGFAGDFALLETEDRTSVELESSKREINKDLADGKSAGPQEVTPTHSPIWTTMSAASGWQSPLTEPVKNQEEAQ
jgi:hypothetical protein